METTRLSIKGIYRDVLKERDNTITYDSGWVSNCIADRCRILLSAFMKNAQPKGIQYLAVGQGLESWDTEGVEPPDSSITQLADANPFKIHVDDLNLFYMDEFDGETEGPTNRIQITATLNFNKPPVAPLSSYPLREFGLFGQFFDGSEYHDYLINYIRHPVIYKSRYGILTRIVRLYF